MIMGTKKNNNGINFKRHPYRGVFRDVANKLYPESKPEDQMVVRVFRKYKNGNLKIRKMISEECDKREALYLEMEERKPVNAEA